MSEAPSSKGLHPKAVKAIEADAYLSVEYILRLIEIGVEIGLEAAAAEMNDAALGHPAPEHDCPSALTLRALRPGEVLRRPR